MTNTNLTCELIVNWKDYFEYEKMKLSNLSFNSNVELIPNDTYYKEIFENHLNKIFNSGV